MSISNILNNTLSAAPLFRYIPEFNPPDSHIRALTLEGEPYLGSHTKFFAYYGLPKNAGKKVPAVVLIHGGGGHAYHCWVRQWNDRGYAAIAMDTTGYMPKIPNAGYKEGDNENWHRVFDGILYQDGYVCGPDNDKLKSCDKPVGEQWMLHALSCAIRSHNFLRSQPEIDTEKIGVMGISWGGVITSLLMGYDRRFAFAVPVYGSGYLKDGLSSLCAIFRHPQVQQNWLAENRFDLVNIPVLWLAWNDDCAFSIQANTNSYLHTVQYNPHCRLSLVDQMWHSHYWAWQRHEPFWFADWIVAGGPAMPQITDESQGNTILLRFTADPGTKAQSATLYYLTAPMKYQNYDKYGWGTNSFMVGKWQSQPLEIRENAATGRLPKDAACAYKEILFSCCGKSITITTPYKEW